MVSKPVSTPRFGHPLGLHSPSAPLRPPEEAPCHARPEAVTAACGAIRHPRGRRTSTRDLPTSPLYLPCISLISPLHLTYISPTSPLYLPYISPIGGTGSRCATTSPLAPTRSTWRGAARTRARSSGPWRMRSPNPNPNPNPSPNPNPNPSPNPNPGPLERPMADEEPEP